MITITLKKGADKPVRSGHPWIFSGAVASCEGSGASGEVCRVVSFDKTFLGTGFYNSVSSICVRMLTRGPGEFGKDELFRRISLAVAARKELTGEQTDSLRLVNSEGDFLPGLTLDKFASGVVIQLTTAGMDRLRGDLVETVKSLLNPAFIYEKSDNESRKREGLDDREGIDWGVLPESLRIQESGILYNVELLKGQKTGFFFDQRDNRLMVRNYTKDKRVCDCFCYSGGFSLNSSKAGAVSVTAVDSSREALKSLHENCALNNCSNVSPVCEDIFQFLRSINPGQFDVIILDPPKFARHKGEIERAARGYKDLNLQAFRKISAGGIVFTFSCSGAIDRRLFGQIIFGAAADAARQIQVLHHLGASPDHPFNIAHPEGDYLKGLVLRVL